jgi:hypothetical protein
MIRRLHFATTAVLMIVTLAGCGGAGSDGTTSGASGTATESRGTGAAIADISIPLAEGADAVATSRSGPMTIVQYIVPLERQAATIAFYDEWTSARPGEYQRTEAATGGVTWQNAPGPDGERHIIAVLSPLEGDDFVAVTLTAGMAE